MNSKVSILMPAYNAEKFISRAVGSVLDQTYQNFEFLICDDGSTDKTPAIIESFADPRIKTYSNAQNMGYLRTFNKLLGLSSGDFVAFLDSDDWCSPDKIQKQLETFEQNPGLGLCGSNYARVDEKGRVVEISKYPLSPADIRDFVSRNIRDMFTAGSAVMVSREVVDKVGGYREYFEECVGEDFDWMRRIVENFECRNIPDVTYFYRVHWQTLTRKVKLDIKQRHVFEIIEFLATQRAETGKDSVMTGDMRELDNFIGSIALNYEADPSLLNRRTAFEYAVAGQTKLALTNLFAAVLKRPLYLANYKAMVLVIVAIVFPNRFLLWAKTLFGNKHISQNL